MLRLTVHSRKQMSTGYSSSRHELWTTFSGRNTPICSVGGRRSGVLAKDILTVGPEELPQKYGLIITSPPYPNAYEYWLYHKYRMYWLGEDPLAVRNAEIGARPNYFKRNPETPEDFRRQMSHCFDLFRQVTLPFALVCIVIGRSVIRGNVIDNAELLRSAAHENGFQHLASAARRIPTTRKALNPVHGTINAETLLVFLRQES